MEAWFLLWDQTYLSLLWHFKLLISYGVGLLILGIDPEQWEVVVEGKVDSWRAGALFWVLALMLGVVFVFLQNIVEFLG